MDGDTASIEGGGERLHLISLQWLILISAIRSKKTVKRWCLFVLNFNISYPYPGGRISLFIFLFYIHYLQLRHWISLWIETLGIALRRARYAI